MTIERFVSAALATAAIACGSPCENAWLARGEGCPSDCNAVSGYRVVEDDVGAACTEREPHRICTRSEEPSLDFVCVFGDGERYWVPSSFEGGEGWRGCSDEEAAAPTIADLCAP